MNDNYECPRCHNVFPSSNRIMHDARCTVEKPLPLDASRIQIQKEKEKEKEEKVVVEEEQQKKIPEIIKKPPSGEFPDVFECDICHQLCMEKERKDHMLCHNLENEERNRQENFEVSPQEIARQKAIEKQIERNKRNNERNNNRNNNNQNNIFPNLGNSDLDIGDPNANLGLGNFLNNLGNAIYGPHMPHMPNMNNNGNNGRSNNNTNNNRSNVNSNVVIHYTTIGPNGQRIERTYQSNGGNQNQEIPQMPQMPPMFFSSSSSSSSSDNRRRNISFFDFNNGLFDDFFTQFLQRMGSRENPTDEEILNELPETQIEDASKLDPEKRNCIICLEDFKNGDKAIILPCIHIFHNECIKNWLKTQNTCPICKFKLTGDNINAPGTNGGNI